MTSIWSWSKNAADNDDADSSIVWLENQAPSTVNNSARQMMGRVAELLEDVAPVRASTGAANVYNVTINSSPPGWTQNLRFTFRAHQANTSAALVSVNGLPTKPLRRRSGVALAPAEIDSGAPLTCVYVQATDEVLIVAGQAPALGTSADVVARIVRTGTTMLWHTSTIPAGWLECNGAAVSRTTYAELFGVLGTSYGPGDGATTFNLPDYRGKFPRGWANGSTNDPDRASRTNRGDGTTGDQPGTNQAAATASHTHGATLSTSVSGTLPTTATASGGTLAVSVSGSLATTATLSGGSALSVSTSGTLSTTATLSGGTALAVSVSGTRTGSTSGSLTVSASGVTDGQGLHDHTYQVPYAGVLYGAGGSGTVYTAATTAATTSAAGHHAHNVTVSGSTSGSLSVTTSGTLTGTATGTVAGTATGTMTGTATGTVTGTATGTLTGAATGTLTGTATGTLTGTATGTTDATGGSETRPINISTVFIILANPAQASAATLGVAGLGYYFSSSTTDADPGSGRLRFNNATLASVTAIYISETDGYGAPMAAVLQSYAVNTQLYIYKIGAPQNYLFVQTGGIATDAGSYDKFTSLSVVSSNGSFADGDPVAVVPFRSSLSGSSIDLPEISDPAAPAANTARLYAKDVSSTTQLYMRVGEGTIVPITGKAALDAIFASLSAASAFNSGDKLIAFVGGSAQVIDYNDLPSSGGSPPTSILGSDEGAAFDFLARTAIINDFDDALSDSGRPHDLLTISRAATATYVGRDRLLKTAAVNTLRYDHNPSTGAPKGALIEVAATNLLLNSEAITEATWGKVDVTTSANVIAAPNGTTTADKLIEAATTGVHYIFGQSGISTAQTYTFTVFAKAAERSRVMVQLSDFTLEARAASFDLSAGTILFTDAAGSVWTNISSSIEAYAGGWYRLRLTGTKSASGTANVAISLISSGTTTLYAGDGTSGVHIWGAQLEVGPYATSYIPTTSATVTRAADSVSIATSLIPLDAAQGTVFVEFSFDSAPSTLFAALDLGDVASNERFTIYVNTFQTIFEVVDGGAYQAAIADGVAPSAGVVRKSAMAYRANDFKACSNGGTVFTDTSGTIPTPTHITLGRLTGGFGPDSGHIRKCAYISRPLTSTELQALTA